LVEEEGKKRKEIRKDYLMFIVNYSAPNDMIPSAILSLCAPYARNIVKTMIFGAKN